MPDRSDCIRAMPVLEVADVERSAAFYVETLGFVSHGMWGETDEPPAFCIVQRDTVTIALDRSHEARPIPINQYWAAYIYVADVESLSADFRRKGAEIVRNLQDMPYGCRDFDVRDPDGHLIAFGQDMNPGKEKRAGLG